MRIYSDPGAPIGAGVVRGIVEEFVGSVESGITSIQLGLTQLAMSGAVPPAELPALGQAMGERLFSADGVIGDLRTSSLIRVRAQSASPTGGEKISTLAFIAPAMALLFLMYAVSLGARTLLSERQEGTLARMLAAPVTSSQVLSGKVAAIFLTGFIQLGVLILLSTTLFQLRWGDPLGVLVVVIAAALAATGWGLLIASIASSSGQVAMLGMALTLIFGILGGSFFDTSQSGPLVANVSRITPNRWALDAFNALALGDGLNDITRPVLVLLLMAAVLFAAAAISFRRRQGALLTP